MIYESNLKTFKIITEFVNELNSMFGKKQKSLSLYSRLITKTLEVYNDKSAAYNEDETERFNGIVQKHINSFKNFCVKNNNAILTKNSKKIVDSNITYSEKVYINMVNIFNMSDFSTEETIWKYLLTISALVDSSSKAKQILLGEKNNESDFLNKLITKVEDNINPDTSNPMEAVSSLLSSGVLTDLISSITTGFSNGELDMNKLMNTMNKMLDTCEPADKSDQNIDMLKNMMSNMMNTTSQMTKSISENTNITEITDKDDKSPVIQNKEPLVEELLSNDKDDTEQ
jgi:hypothetical protein